MYLFSKRRTGRTFVYIYHHFGRDEYEYAFITLSPDFSLTELESQITLKKSSKCGEQSNQPINRNIQCNIPRIRLYLPKLNLKFISNESGEWPGELWDEIQISRSHYRYKCRDNQFKLSVINFVLKYSMAEHWNC